MGTIQSAPGDDQIGRADGDGLLEGDLVSESIIPGSFRFVKDVTDLGDVVSGIVLRQIHHDPFRLIGQTVFIGDAEGLGQRIAHGLVMKMRLILPQVGIAGIPATAGVGDIKYVPELRTIAGVVKQGDTLASSKHIAVHDLVPDAVLSAGLCIRALEEDHYLIFKPVLVHTACGIQKTGPFTGVFRQTRYLMLHHFPVVLVFGGHTIPPRTRNEPSGHRTEHRSYSEPWPAPKR